MDIERGVIVVVSCQSPREKLWGLLQRLDAVGAVVRGLDLGSVEDWLHQEREGSERLIAPSTVFVPMHRVERIYLDESGPIARSFAARYAEVCGREVSEALSEPSTTSPLSTPASSSRGGG